MKNAFTLIELLIVITIVVVLQVVAFSLYQNYIVRVQVTTALQLLYLQQLEILKYRDINGVMPTAESVAISSPSSNDVSPPFISTTTVETNATENANIIKIDVQFSDSANSELANKSIILEGKIKDNGTWTWLCRNSTDSNAIKNKHLPSECQYTGNSCPASFCLE